jgi:hypothetical protein
LDRINRIGRHEIFWTKVPHSQVAFENEGTEPILPNVCAISSG